MRIFTMILIGLHYLNTHKDRIQHRDLKPGNILIFNAPAPYNYYTVKITDFGVSKVNFSTINAA
jgi:serine/threonine protein kinase